MKVSVVIPSFNRAHTLARALDSVLAQSDIDHVELEVIVIDDGSTDNTQTLVETNYPHLTLLAQDNQGVSSARNLGLKHASGEWIAFLDSDDEWLPHKLSRQFSLLTQLDLLVCHTEEQWIRNGVRVNQMKKHRKYGGQIFEYCLPLCAMSPSSIVIHKSVFSEVGCFDEALPACEDYDLWLRITSRYEVAFVSEPCINKYGGHDDQLSRQYWGMDRFRVIALQNLLNKDDNCSFLQNEQRANALNTLLSKLNILRTGALKHNNLEMIEYCDHAIEQWSPTV